MTTYTITFELGGQSCQHNNVTKAQLATRLHSLKVLGATRVVHW